MDNIFNINFLLLVVIIVFLFNHRKKLYQSKLGNFTEKFTNKNSLDINYLDLHKNIHHKKLYTLEHDTLSIIPVLVSSFKYSMEYLLGQELTQIYRIKQEESLGLYHNIKSMNELDNSNKLYLCSETDYYDAIKNKKLNNYKFVCGLYYIHFLLFVRVESEITSWLDIAKYLNTEVYNKKNIIRIGIPTDDSNSYQDAKKLFSCLGINIKNTYTNIKFIFGNEKDLFGNLKFNIKNKNSIDILYLTTSEKHPYLIEYLSSYNINVLSTSSLNQDLLEMQYHGNHAFQNRIEKDKFTRIIKKKNMYEEEITDSFKLINNESEKKIIGPKFFNTKSSRVIIVAHQNLDSDYVKYLLRNIYGSIDSLRNKLNKYLLIKEKQNLLTNPLEPYEMSYCHQMAEYHKGAYQFYQDIQLISDKQGLTDNQFVEENQYF